MNFGRRNTQSTPQAVPTAPTSDKPVVVSRSNPITKYIYDSYNGLYKILLEPSMPTKATIALLIVGLLIGLLWAYQLAPTQFVGANPNRLNQAAQDQWIRMVAGNYDRLFYNDTDTASLLNQIESPSVAIERLLNAPDLTESDRLALQKIQPIAQTVAGTPSPADPGLLGNLFSGFLLPLLLILILVPIFVLLWRILIYPNIGAALVQRVNESRDPALKARNNVERADLRRLKEQRVELERIKGAMIADEELGEPVVQLLKVYQKGRPYDESNEIEVGEEFLGQCGSVIPDSLNGNPLAFEVWLFDMQASNNKNSKKLFVAPAVASDQALLARLTDESEVDSTDVAVIQPGAKLTVEGETIRLLNEIIALETDDTGHVTSFRMKVTAWRKRARVASVPTASLGEMMGTPVPVQPMAAPSTPPPIFNASPMLTPLSAASPAPLPPMRPLSDYDDIEFDPPPPAFRPAPPTPLGQPAPQSFAPPIFPPAEDDDPFGNTGDFTPLPPRR